MLIYKIFIFLGLALLAILVIENMVVGLQAYILWTMGRVWALALLAGIIGGFIGFGLHGALSSDNKYLDENDDDFNF